MSIVCFGEALWDVLPGGRQPGGAPFNVAVHLHQLGQPARLISRVGADEPGAALLAFLAARGLPTDLVQRDSTHSTGLVQAHVTDRYEVTYDIGQPVAWDYLVAAPGLPAAVAAAEMLVFGSLAARQAPSRDTLYELLPRARFRVFDVNLRPPHYARAVVEHLLGQADLVKMNEAELREILGWFGPAGPADESALAGLAARFGLQAVCVTRGADGAWLWRGGQLYRSPGRRVEVQDTIGSGDAFLAALLLGWQAGQAPADCLRFATAAGALVATHRGATPAITRAQVAALLE